MGEPHSGRSIVRVRFTSGEGVSFEKEMSSLSEIKHIWRVKKTIMQVKLDPHFPFFSF